ncbi:DUF3397 domain-containing protein [Bacillus sp. V3B]|uniref:DUF3397 domain-containing protein n=1 Tax=Bacillus sp. V3B TaxID=2804915 RepID=UPI0021091D1E|nr:DUF3397 domain-containing protein [Bacillus sp. V3B]MCQ6273991.1 DUF3397 domain-containing protein [Bacillus sp. V3B]
MPGFFSSIIATFVTIPLLGYIIVFVISKLVTKKHRISVQIAIDVTTLLLVISVHYFIMTIWDRSLLWVILLIMIIIAIVFVLVHWKLKHEIQFKKIFKGFWRFNFLLFSFVYIILLVYGLILRVSLSITAAAS